MSNLRDLNNLSIKKLVFFKISSICLLHFYALGTMLIFLPLPVMDFNDVYCLPPCLENFLLSSPSFTGNGKKLPVLILF